LLPEACPELEFPHQELRVGELKSGRFVPGGRDDNSTGCADGYQQCRLPLENWFAAWKNFE
jgi:hypothetical protein